MTNISSRPYAYITSMIVYSLATLASFTSIVLRADIRELKDNSGKCIQVSIDFNLENIQVTTDKSMKFVARTTEGGVDLAFEATIEKFQMATNFGGDKYPVMRSGVTIRSQGEQTIKLENLVLEKLSVPKNGDESCHITAPYSAVSSVLDTGFSQVMVLHLFGIGISYDEKGQETALDGCRVDLIIDAPMRRLTAYYTNQGGYSGLSPADKARMKWLNNFGPKAK